MKIRVEGLLFDMDGVLVSSIGSVVRSWRKWAKHYDVPGAEEIEVEHGTRAVQIMQKLKPGVDEADGLKLIEDMEIDDVHDIETLPGARTLLESLPPDRWAIVTSATFRLLVARLQAAGLPQPDKIVAGDHVAHGKPHPEPYLRGAAMIGVEPRECVVVEDAPSGVAAGVAAGCRVLGVLGTHSEEQLRAAGVSWIVPSLLAVKASTTDGGIELQMDVV